MKTTAIAVLLLLAALPTLLHAQIVQDKNAVKLRVLWEIRGPEEQAYYGNGVGGGFDVNNDGLGDFAVRFRGEWRVFYGDSVKLNDSVRWRFHATGDEPSAFFAGDFFGTGRKAIGVVRDSLARFSTFSHRFFIFRTDDGYLPDTPAVVIDMKQDICFWGHQVVDLDGDGADELIIYHTCGQLVPTQDAHEVWIYRGGPDFGTLPPIIIQDSERPSQIFEAAGGDFDGDGLPDIMTAGQYADQWPTRIKRLKFYFGSSDHPFSWQQPSRIIDITDDLERDLGTFIKVFDCDGDGLPDIWIEGRDGNSHLFRSAAPGKNARTRSFHLDDADRVLRSPSFGIYGSAGYLNDSTRRYQMTALIGNVGSTARMLLFSGGPNGPDSTYDAWYEDGLGSIFGWMKWIDDCDGDGWPEIICGDPDWYGSPFLYGKATVLAGGPEIPRDTATSSVQHIQAEQKPRALSFWPNPALDRVQIAWRGDLRQMPHRFTVHNMLGVIVTQAEVEPWRGTATWLCGDVPPGSYLLTAYDEHGLVVASATLIKR